MRILLDTNIILDLFLEREPFVEDAALIWKAHEGSHLTAFVSALTPVNVFYIGRKLKGVKLDLSAVQALLATLPVAAVNQAVLEAGLQLGFKYSKDAVKHACATAGGLEAIITRNISDFAGAEIDVFAPTEFIKAQSSLFENLLLDSEESS